MCNDIRQPQHIPPICGSHSDTSAVLPAKSALLTVLLVTCAPREIFLCPSHYTWHDPMTKTERSWPGI
jgi:hypothetical protein